MPESQPPLSNAELAFVVILLGLLLFGSYVWCNVRIDNLSKRLDSIERKQP